jgi:hypothetical protein
VGRGAGRLYVSGVIHGLLSIAIRLAVLAAGLDCLDLKGNSTIPPICKYVIQTSSVRGTLFVSNDHSYSIRKLPPLRMLLRLTPIHVHQPIHQFCGVCPSRQGMALNGIFTFNRHFSAFHSARELTQTQLAPSQKRRLINSGTNFLLCGTLSRDRKPWSCVDPHEGTKVVLLPN